MEFGLRRFSFLYTCCCLIACRKKIYFFFRRIVDHVKASRQRNAQRSQWLNKSRDANTSSGVVTSSMIASPSPSQTGYGTRGTPQAFQSLESPVLTPVKRSVTNDPVNPGEAAKLAAVSVKLSPNTTNTNHSESVVMTNGQSIGLTRKFCFLFFEVNFLKEIPFDLSAVISAWLLAFEHRFAYFRKCTSLRI
ncbi:hypothetical protein FBUS_11407 [Fasciolopsis buskii]|uniref:Uncharacterized protein n=1 Tax=Fasciolopsis buskii TaxID=27845 RepID=A0A8E0RN15_9TREM|nr:hypothetical protein FBUS_11407 [Fasciolopsis buski]